MFSGCSITGVTDNVCGDEVCTPGEFGYTCGERRQQAPDKGREMPFGLIPAPVFGKLTLPQSLLYTSSFPVPPQLLPTSTNIATYWVQSLMMGYENIADLLQRFVS